MSWESRDTRRLLCARGSFPQGLHLLLSVTMHLQTRLASDFLLLALAWPVPVVSMWPYPPGEAGLVGRSVSSMSTASYGLSCSHTRHASCSCQSSCYLRGLGQSLGLASHTQKTAFNWRGHCQASEYEQRRREPSLSLPPSRSASEGEQGSPLLEPSGPFLAGP